MIEKENRKIQQQKRETDKDMHIHGQPYQTQKLW